MWNLEKEKLLSDLIVERSRVELHPESIRAWNLGESYVSILLRTISEKEKQSILNQLIRDKNAFLSSLASARSMEVAAISRQIDDSIKLVEE